MKSIWTARLVCAAVACWVIVAEAATPPRSLEQLRQSDLIVVGTIKELRIETERSQLNPGFGNYDWAIYVTLAVEQVVKGRLDDDAIEFKCFRVKYRRSLTEYFGPGGHRWIPGTGTRICAYLNMRESGWMAALPNGLTEPESVEYTNMDFRPGTKLSTTAQITGRHSRRYTFFLSLESWLIVCLVSALLKIMSILFTRMFARRRKATMLNMEQGD